jgi:glucose/arabinose dehydrogenase
MKMRTLKLTVGIAICSVFLVAERVDAAIAGATHVASGLSAPIFVTHAPGDRSRLFIAQRGGAIRILNLETGVLEPTPFLSMAGISVDGEGGFLGLAFHPNYFNSGMPGHRKFYVNITTNNTTITRIREFEVSAGDPNVANAGSLREVMSFTQPQTNHNGGWIGFSPNNNYLYIATGDGGGGFDDGAGHTAGTGNAQDTTSNLLGKMLRIDPLDPDGMGGASYSIPPTNPFVGITGDDEIWSYGLRNPFRASFDRITGDLWIGDVGQNQREEIDFESASSTGGLNYGWRYREGFAQTENVGLPYNPAWTQPVYDYDRDNDPLGGVVVTGGYVYRGPDPSLQGRYFFMDSRNSASAADDNYWMFNPANPFGTVMNIDTLLFPTAPPAGSALFPVSFGEDAVGNLYIAYASSGQVYRIATNQLLNGDFDADGDVDDDDLAEWRAGFGGVNPNPASDGNGNGIFDAADYVAWRNNLGADVHTGAGAATGGAVPEPTAAALIVAAIAGSLSVFSVGCRRRCNSRVPR